MLEIRIGYGDMVSKQMGIPMSASDFEVAKKILDEGKARKQPVTVRSLVSPVQPLSEMITGMDYGDETRRKELDFLDTRLRHMTRKEQDIFSVALTLETPGTLKEIINLSYNLDSYDLLEDISDPGRTAAELLRRGKQIEIPEVLYPMLDFERIRDSYFADHKGDYCPSGLVLKREDTVDKEVYQNYLPDPGYDKNSLFLLHLRRPSRNGMVNVSLAIPADEGKMELAKKELGIQEFSECQWNQYGGPLDELRHYLPVGSEIEELNRFAWFLKEKVLDGTEQIVEKLKAVLTAECPRSLDEAVGVINDLDHYRILSEFRTPEDYARWRMKDDGSLYVSRFCEAYLDWNSLGKALMKRDGTRWSELGTVLCDEWHCNELSENASVIRLYSPLQAELVDEDEYCSSLSSVGLISYEEDIRDAIAADDILKTEKGLGEYLDNQLLKQRVISMRPTVERYQYNLWGVLEIKSHGELNPEELEVIKREWAGQACDGWGECFSQEGIECESDCDLYVYFGHSKFRVQTEQELKGIVQEQELTGMEGMGGIS